MEYFRARRRRRQIRNGPTGGAYAVLRPIFEEFVEGSDTADLKAAEHLLGDPAVRDHTPMRIVIPS
jgi:hypothetical protein